MCADMVLRKRAAMHAGEIGLFLDTDIFTEEFGHIKMNTDVEVKATQPRSLRQLRFAWALARKVAESGALGDCDQTDCMDYLKMKCRHVRYVTNVHRDGTDTIVVPKSIRFAAMDQTAFQRLMNRMIWVVATEILPDVPEGALRAEIEAMAGVSAPEPEVKATPKRRRRTAEEVATAAEPKQRNSLAAPVSVIPPDYDPVEVTEPPADAAPPAPTASAKPAPSVSPAATVGGAGPVPGKPPTTVQGWKEWCKAWLEELYGDASKTDVDVLTRGAAKPNSGMLAESRRKNARNYSPI